MERVWSLLVIYCDWMIKVCEVSIYIISRLKSREWCELITGNICGVHGKLTDVVSVCEYYMNSIGGVGIDSITVNTVIG